MEFTNGAYITLLVSYCKKEFGLMFNGRRNVLSVNEAEKVPKVHKKISKDHQDQN